MDSFLTDFIAREFDDVAQPDIRRGGAAMWQEVFGGRGPSAVRKPRLTSSS